MKKSEVQIGATYLVKVSGNLVPVKIVREHLRGGWEGVSAKTGRTIRIRSAQRLRRRLVDAPWSMLTSEANHRSTAQDATDAF